MGTLGSKIKRGLLFGGDLAFLYISLWLTLLIRYGLKIKDIHPDLQNPLLLPFTIIYIVWLIVFYIIGLYDLQIARNNLNFYATLFKALLINASLGIAFFYFIPYFGVTPKTILFINLLIFALLWSGWRQIYNKLIAASVFLNNVFFIGETKETKDLVEYIKKNPQLGFRIKKVAQPQEVALIFDLIEYLIKDRIQTIVTAIDPRNDIMLVRNLYYCLPLNITLYDLPTFYEKITGKVPISAIEKIWFLENLMREKKSVYESVKRAFDIIFALILGIISLALFPFIALAIKIDSAGPVFYKQKRVGENNQIFNIYKFRSMIKDAEKDGAKWARKKDERVTKVGKFLRASRLDELPQLLNVLRGDMSFVGPRPERPEFVFGANLQRQIPFYQIRHLVKPGLTGWAQINFEYGASLEDTIEKLQYDLFYIKNRSFVLDAGIVLKTIKIVLSAAGR